MFRRTLAVLAVALTGVAIPMARGASQAVTESGYLKLADGTELRYTVTHPAQGRAPVAMEYDGYCEGIGPANCNDRDLTGRLLAAGYAIVGFSIRGTGCSSGTFDFRSPQENRDGAAAVEWAARQRWSNGRVGLYGDSFPGLTQPGIAALRPAGLAAIAPFQIVDDVYRDVGYPGGLLNAEFGAFWGMADQPLSDAENPLYAAQQSDPTCAQNYATHEALNPPQNIFVAGTQHPYNDGYWQPKAVGDAARNIAVPVLGCAAWQDDEVGSRATWTFFRRIASSRLWLIASNGYHGMCDQGNEIVEREVVAFFDRYVRGVRNGFERTPHVQIWHEAYAVTHPSVGVGTVTLASANKPSWITTFPAWPPALRDRPFYLASGGRLEGQPTRASTTETYRFPAPSAGTEDGVVAGQNNVMWQRQVPPGGSLAWTSAPLKRDLEVLGPASADLWLTSTQPDTAVQVTVTEVRPDGQETYVARGWQLASLRGLDARQSTPTWPVHTDRAADARPLTRGQPTLVRVEIMPFDHVFRAGSRLRLIVDTPSQTGGWNFEVPATVGTNSILHDASHRSRVVFGVVPGGHAPKPLPACNTLLNQPCRPDAFPQQ